MVAVALGGRAAFAALLVALTVHSHGLPSRDSFGDGVELLVQRDAASTKEGAGGNQADKVMRKADFLKAAKGTVAATRKEAKRKEQQTAAEAQGANREKHLKKQHAKKHRGEAKQAVSFEVRQAAKKAANEAKSKVQAEQAEAKARAMDKKLHGDHSSELGDAKDRKGKMAEHVDTPEESEAKLAATDAAVARLQATQHTGEPISSQPVQKTAAVQKTASAKQPVQVLASKKLAAPAATAASKAWSAESQQEAESKLSAADRGAYVMSKPHKKPKLSASSVHTKPELKPTSNVKSHRLNNSPPGSRTEKLWQNLAQEADDVSRNKQFSARLLRKTAKAETAYVGLLRKEKKYDQVALRVKARADKIVKDFYDTAPGESQTPESDLGEGADLSQDSPNPRVLTNPRVVQLQQQLGESKASAAEAAAAEAEAEEVVKKERKQLAVAEAEAEKPAPESKTTKALKQQKKEYKRATTSLQHDAAVAKSPQQGQVAAEAAKAAAAAEAMAEKKVAEEERHEQAKHDNKAFTSQADAAQSVHAAEVQAQTAVSNAQDAAAKVQKTNSKLNDAEKDVAKLESEKAKQKANAVPAAFKALDKEMSTNTKLSAELQALSDKAQTAEAGDARLDSTAHRVRNMAIDIKNSAERQLDHLGSQIGKVHKSNQLGEAMGKSKWKNGLHKDAAVLRKQRSQMKALVKKARAMSLDAAQIQEKQYLAADSSSRLEVDAHVLSKTAVSVKSEVKALESQKKAGLKPLKAELNKLSKHDHKMYLGVEHLSGEAMNAEAAEASGVTKTEQEVGIGNHLLHAIADDLLP